MGLASDAILADVLSDLVKPLDYVCGVLANLHKCQKLNESSAGDAVIYIGVTGTGQRPYYRIAFLLPTGTERVFDTFFDNHVSFKSEDLPVTGGSSWSSRYMTLPEVAVLRGKLKG